MEGHIHQNDLQLTSLAFNNYANYLSHLAEQHPYQQYIIETEGGGNHYVPQWVEHRQMDHHYVDYLAENGISEKQGEASYNNSGMGSFKATESFLAMGAQKEEVGVLSTSFQQVGYLRPQHEETLGYNFLSTDHEILNQKQGPNEDHHNAAQHHSKVTTSTSSFPKRPCTIRSRQRATVTDRHRRSRINVGLGLLQELLPNSKDGNKANILDDTIDYINYLQLHMKILPSHGWKLAWEHESIPAVAPMSFQDLYLEHMNKELSQNRLGGISASNPFIFLEGYGHYLVHENMANGPLEEMMGMLLEVNPSAASQLLESRGLFMMPMALAEGLH